MQCIHKWHGRLNLWAISMGYNCFRFGNGQCTMLGVGFSDSNCQFYCCFLSLEPCKTTGPGLCLCTSMQAFHLLTPARRKLTGSGHCCCYTHWFVPGICGAASSHHKELGKWSKSSVAEWVCSFQFLFFLIMPYWKHLRDSRFCIQFKLSSKYYIQINIIARKSKLSFNKCICLHFLNYLTFVKHA